MKPFLLALLLAAGAASAAPYTAVLVDTNGVQRVPAMLTLTNVVIQGFAMADIDDVDISGRSIDDVLAWDGTNHVYVAQGGHDPVTLGTAPGSLDGQEYNLTIEQLTDFLEDATLQLAAVLGPADGPAEIAAQAGQNIMLNPDDDSGDGTVDINGHLSVAGAISGDGSAITNLVMTVPVTDWKGPRDTEIPGWAYKSYATTNTTTSLCEGMVNWTTTQQTATLDAKFTTPAQATAWAPTPIVLKLLGDSTTSSDVKYRLYVYRDGTSAAVFDSTANQVLTSTSAVTTVSISAASLGTFYPGKTYTIRLEPSVRYNGSALGLYIHSLTVQVLK